MRTTIVIGSILSIAGVASAQSFSSFQQVPISGITVQNVGLLQYKVTLNGGAVANVGGTDYAITDIFGFWALSSDIDLGGSTTSFDVWGGHASNSGLGGIVGWKTNPNTGITVGNSETFTFDSLATADVDAWGYHIRVDGQLPGGGDTFFAYVPTPATASLFAAAGLVGLGRRRR